VARSQRKMISWVETGNDQGQRRLAGFRAIRGAHIRGIVGLEVRFQTFHCHAPKHPSWIACLPVLGCLSLCPHSPRCPAPVNGDGLAGDVARKAAHEKVCEAAGLVEGDECALGHWCKHDLATYAAL
jgi:hypothetical protein